jgi:hypothetical protein
LLEAVAEEEAADIKAADIKAADIEVAEALDEGVKLNKFLIVILPFDIANFTVIFLLYKLVGVAVLIWLKTAVIFKPK